MLGPMGLCRPIPTPQQISRAWPYGVRQERVEGRQVAGPQLRASTNSYLRLCTDAFFAHRSSLTVCLDLLGFDV